MVNVAVELGYTVLQTPFVGLQTLRVTLTLEVVSKGNVAVPPGGTMIARLIWEVSVTVAVRYWLGVYVPETEIPTWVAMLGLGLLMNPVPVSVRVAFVPGAAAGRLAGQIEVSVAVGDRTFTVKVTRVMTAGVPQVMDAMPVRGMPATAELKAALAERDRNLGAEAVGQSASQGCGRCGIERAGTCNAVWDGPAGRYESDGRGRNGTIPDRPVRACASRMSP
jgi:hypothetical protein